MKTFKQMRIEGWFDKKEKEDPDYEELKKLVLTKKDHKCVLS